MSVNDADTSPEVGEKKEFEDSNLSPNIRSSAEESGDANFDEEEVRRKRETVEIDGVPIDSEDIKFHSDNIKAKDQSDLFVKVEGAKRLAREKERAAKKESEEHAKRLRDAAREEKKQQQKIKNEEKNVRRQAANEVRKQKFGKVKEFIIKFKRIILIVVAAIIFLILTFTVFIPAIKSGIVAKQEADTARVIEENRTDMLKMLAKLIGKELTKEEIKETVKSFGGDMTIDFDKEEGSIYHKDGGVEVIRFEVVKKNNKTIAHHFRYINSVDGHSISISGGEDGYYYANGEELRESNNPSELIDECILFITEHES